MIPSILKTYLWASSCRFVHCYFIKPSFQQCQGSGVRVWSYSGEYIGSPRQQSPGALPGLPPVRKLELLMTLVALATTSGVMLRMLYASAYGKSVESSPLAINLISRNASVHRTQRMSMKHLTFHPPESCLICLTCASQ